jgi:hypothetical protein
VKNAAIEPSAQRTQTPRRFARAEKRISSLEKNPANGGIPAMARVESMKVQKVTGIHFLRPPICRTSCSPPMAWITDPEPRNRHALKKAWVMRWKIDATKAPTPAPRNMKPSWLTVEYASTFLMSVCARPIVAAKSAVIQPTTATTIIAPGACQKRAELRASM